MLWRVVELQPVPGRIVNSHRGPNVCHLAPAHHHFTLFYPVSRFDRSPRHQLQKKGEESVTMRHVLIFTHVNSLRRVVHDVCSSKCTKFLDRKI